MPLTGFDTALDAVLAACTRHHRMTTGQLLWLSDLLDVIARAANGLVTSPDGEPIRMRSLRFYAAPDDGPVPAGGDWRDATALLLMASRIEVAINTEIPSGPGLRELDHRVLLVLRDLVAAPPAAFAWIRAEVPIPTSPGFEPA